MITCKFWLTLCYKHFYWQNWTNWIISPKGWCFSPLDPIRLYFPPWSKMLLKIGEACHLSCYCSSQVSAWTAEKNRWHRTYPRIRLQWYCPVQTHSFGPFLLPQKICVHPSCLRDRPRAWVWENHDKEMPRPQHLPLVGGTKEWFCNISQ